MGNGRLPPTIQEIMKVLAVPLTDLIEHDIPEQMPVARKERWQHSMYVDG